MNEGTTQYIVVGTRNVREQEAFTDESFALAEAVRWSADGLISVEVQSLDGSVWTVAANHTYPEPF